MVLDVRPVAVATLLLAASTALGGCTAQPGSVTTGLIYCTSPDGDNSKDTEEVEYRQGDEVVASTPLQVGDIYRAEVPADRRTDIYVDGRLVGSAGDDDTHPAAPGGYTALLGEGCPTLPAP